MSLAADRFAKGWLRHLSRGLAVLLLLLAALVVVAHGRYLLAVNSTDSLDGNLFLISLGLAAPARGEIAAFAYDGSRWGLPADALWAKRVAGLPGDAIDVRADTVWVAGAPAGRLSPQLLARNGLSAVAAGTVPAGYLFVVGEHSDSLDSRYAEFGFVAWKDLAGVALRLW